MNVIETDVLVLGAGAAGLVTALNAPSPPVTVLAPGSVDGPTAPASDLAQGGIAAAVATHDSAALHLQDTLRAAGGHVQLDAARYLCERASSAIDYLHSLGLQFDRAGRDWSLHTEAAHSRARVLHVGDATGAAVMRVLRDVASNAAHVDVLHGVRAVRLLADAGQVRGVLAQGERSDVVAIHARAVVIATGGIGGLYARTTNPTTACGDGLSLALAAGARCAALEFVQFHPTALDVDATRLPLLTEALRGAGARLIDEHGRRVLAGIHPLAELAPRDVVARAVYAAQQRGARVALDARHLDDRDLAAEFPSAHRACLEHGFDLRREPVPVTAAAHYHMGGIAVDLDGRTSLRGLWAAGEAACTGAHGANRLASNSLLEAIVFGRRCGRALSREHTQSPTRCGHGSLTTEIDIDQGVRRDLREMMWRCMGVVRSAASISEGLTYVTRLRELTPPARTLEHSRLLLMEHMLLAAARRTTNCGAHYRSDAIRAPAMGQACA